MFKREVNLEITCDLCGRTNHQIGLPNSPECFSAWQRLSIIGIKEKDLEYRRHELLSDIKHLCPNCNELVYDLMTRKNYWIKVIEKGI